MICCFIFQDYASSKSCSPVSRYITVAHLEYTMSYFLSSDYRVSVKDIVLSMELNHKQKKDLMKSLERKGKRISVRSKRLKYDCSKDQNKKLKKLNASSLETSCKVISQF